MRWFSPLLMALLGCASLAILPLLVIDGWLNWQARDRVFHEPETLPRDYDLALVLGTSKFTASGHVNKFYLERIEAAAELFHQGLISAILVSGDNRHDSYNEPRQMRQDLIALGVPGRYITMDFAGFRTLDSVYRAKHVFGQERLIIVTQPFHLERALFLAQMAKIDAVGYAALSPDWRGAPRVRLRDLLARSLAVKDVLIAVEPHFLGDPVRIDKRHGPNLSADLQN